MNYSIIIPTYNSRKFIEKCVSSILNAGFSGEIIVVDNNSKDDTVFFVKNNFPQIKIVETDKNLGFSGAINIGAKKAQNPYFIFLNPDAIPLKNSLKELDDFIKKENNFGVIGFNILKKDGIHEKFSFGKKTSFSQILRNKFFKKEDALPFLPTKVDWVSGAAMVVPKKVFEKIGGFDEIFFMYFEDQDFCLRVKSLGYHIYFLPNVKIVHFGGKTWASSKLQKKHYYESQDYFFKKHNGFFEYFLMKILRLPYKLINGNYNFLKIFLIILTAIFILLLIQKGFYAPLFSFLFFVIVFLFLFADFKFSFIFLLFSLILGQIFSFRIGESRILVSDVIVAVIFLFWFFKKIIKEEKFKINFSGSTILLFLFFAAVSFLNSFRFFETGEIKTGFLYLIRLIFYTSLYFVFSDFAAKNKNIKFYFNWFLGSVSVLAILGFLQMIFLPDFSFMAEYGFDPHTGRLLSTWFDPNIISEIFVLGIVVVLGFLMFGDKNNHNYKEVLKIILNKWFKIVLLIVFLAALALTFSRSGYLTFLTTIVFLSFLKFKKLFVLLFIIVFIGFFSLPFFPSRFQPGKIFDETAKMRVESWKNALEIIKEKPLFGIGYNNLLLIQGVEGRDSHSKSGFDSSFLTIWAATGIFGFLTLLIIFIQGFFNGFKLLKNKKTEVFGFIILGTLFSFLIHSQFVNSLLYPHLAAIFWPFLGIASQMCYNRKKQ